MVTAIYNPDIWIDTAINRTLDTSKIDLAVQPIRQLTGCISDYRPGLWFEVLARPKVDNIKLDPAKFINRVADLGLARQIDLIVIRNTLSWLNQLGDETCCSVNVSGMSVSAPSFEFQVIDLFSHFPKVDPQQLCFEITETEPITDYDVARRFAMTLRSLGSRIALDDFGEGSSNMRLCAPLVVDYLKIDRRFLRSSSLSKNSALIKGIAAMCRELDVYTVAEGIETQYQHNVIEDLGIHFMQGFYQKGEPECAKGYLLRYKKKLAELAEQDTDNNERW